ncbi:MAG: FmdB family zinc ribbon protein, partial [Dehalococcoidia bacterium]
MPIYEYICENHSCSHRFELRQSFDAEPVAACPLCHSRARRRFHPVPIFFKGSGWYVTDYGRKNPTLSTNEGGSGADKAEYASPKGEEQS